MILSAIWNKYAGVNVFEDKKDLQVQFVETLSSKFTQQSTGAFLIGESFKSKQFR